MEARPGGMTTEALSSTADLEDAREQLLQSFAGLAEVLLDKANVVGEWSIRQVMSHIAVWDRWGVETLAALQRGESPPPPDETVMNTAAQVRYAQASPAEILRDISAARMPLLSRLAAMSDEESARPVYRMGEHLLAADDLAEGFIDHDLEHASEIRAWRKARGL